jgi:L-asparaginase II
MRAPILVEFDRGGHIEARHRGVVVVADAQGNDPHAVGDPDTQVYIRSAIKPFAAALTVATGAADAVGLTPPELAIISGSHSGTDEDVELVRSILTKAGLDESALKNGTKQAPGDEPTKIRLAAAGEEPPPIRQMCSGEHSGLLLISCHNGWSVDRYWEPDHPMEQEIKKLVSRLFTNGEDPKLGIDDCALPNPLASLASIARAFSWLARPEGLPDDLSDLREPFTRVRDAMIENPMRVSGAGQLDTDLVEMTDGAFISKEGAEGVLGAGCVGCGLGIAFHIEDGDKTRRATNVVAIAALEQLGMLEEGPAGKLREAHWPPLMDSIGRQAGTINAAFNLAGRD